MTVVSPARSNVRRTVYGTLGVLLLGLLVRRERMSQSLWYDEMTTVTDYLVRPWSRTLAPAAGEYVPNNHVLHTILARLSEIWFSPGPQIVPPDEIALRLPALIAGLLVPVALAWPLRKSFPVFAVVVAIVAAVNPWLVAIGTEARGYPLLLLLGLVSTNLIGKPGDSISTGPGGAGVKNRTTRPPRDRIIDRRSVAYAVTLAAAIYTVPLAILLAPAHAVAIAVTRCTRWRRWIVGCTAGLLLAALLYVPMWAGLLSYYRNPYPATLSLKAFFDRLPRFAWAGDRVPLDGSVGSIFWVVPVLAVGIGSVLAWRRPAVRPGLVTLLSVTGFGLLLAAAVPAAREVRFVPWAAPLFCLTIAAAITAIPGRAARIIGGLGGITLLLFSLQLDWKMLPNQPIREGIAAADQKVPAGRAIVVLYLGARESIALYGDSAKSHSLIAAADQQGMIDATDRAIDRTGYLPWVLIYFEHQAAARDAAPGEAHGLYDNLVRNYHMVYTLHGRVGAVTLYAPNRPGLVKPRVVVGDAGF